MGIKEKIKAKLAEDRQILSSLGINVVLVDPTHRSEMSLGRWEDRNLPLSKAFQKVAKIMARPETTFNPDYFIKQWTNDGADVMGLDIEIRLIPKIGPA